MEHGDENHDKNQDGDDKGISIDNEMKIKIEHWEISNGLKRM